MIRFSKFRRGDHSDLIASITEGFLFESNTSLKSGGMPANGREYLRKSYPPTQKTAPPGVMDECVEGSESFMCSKLDATVDFATGG
jgi:hypothetical protein